MLDGQWDEVLQFIQPLECMDKFDRKRSVQVHASSVDAEVADGSDVRGEPHRHFSNVCVTVVSSGFVTSSSSRSFWRLCV